jgi:hypothetical protein
MKMTTKYLTIFSNFDPMKLGEKINEIAKGEGMQEFSRYDFGTVWTDSQGFTVTEEYLKKGDKKLVLTIKNSWQRDIKTKSQKALSINND